MKKGEFENYVAFVLALIGIFFYPFFLIPLALIIGHKAQEISKGKYNSGFKLAKTIMWIYIVVIIFLVIFALIVL